MGTAKYPKISTLQFPVAVNFYGSCWVAIATAGRKIYSVVLEYKTWKILVSRFRFGLVISYFVKSFNKGINRDLTIM